MRLFLAVKLDENLAIKLNALQRNIPGCKIKWVEKDNLHLTIHFLGESDSILYKKISVDIESIFKNIETFSFDLVGKGVFPRINRPSVIWVGIKNTPQLQKLHYISYKTLTKYGYNLRSKFKPHVTLGRVKSFTDIEPLKDYLLEDNAFYGRQYVNEVLLMESKLSYRGPKYCCLERFPLKQIY